METDQNKNGNLILKREAILDSNGRHKMSEQGHALYSYSVYGKYKGKDIRADFCPLDRGGYEVLDLLYDMCDGDVQLIIKRDKRQDALGITRSTVSFLAMADTDGIPMEIPVKPQRSSDRSLLDFILANNGMPRLG